MLRTELITSDVFPSFPTSERLDLSHLHLIDDFVYLPSTTAKRIDLEECMNEFEVVEGYNFQPKEDSEWVALPTKPKVSITQTLQNMLELPYNKEEWWKAAVSGFPSDMRGDVWSHLISPESRSLKEKYVKLLNERCENSVEKDISKDICRTFIIIPGFTECQGRRLYNVLKAYSRFDSEVGYCQGINYIAGLILLYIMDEAVAFCLLVDIMKRYRWRELYIKGMPKLVKLTRMLEKRISTELPQLTSHFIESEINLFGLFSHYFLTIFLYSVPLAFGVRVFELFFIEGENVIVECIVNVLNIMQERILEMKFDRVHEYIKTEMISEFCTKYGSNAIKKLVERIKLN